MRECERDSTAAFVEQTTLMYWLVRVKLKLNAETGYVSYVQGRKIVDRSVVLDARGICENSFRLVSVKSQQAKTSYRRAVWKKRQEKNVEN